MGGFWRADLESTAVWADLSGFVHADYIQLIDSMLSFDPTDSDVVKCHQPRLCRGNFVADCKVRVIVYLFQIETLLQRVELYISTFISLAKCYAQRALRLIQ